MLKDKATKKSTKPKAIKKIAKAPVTAKAVSKATVGAVPTKHLTPQVVVTRKKSKPKPKPMSASGFLQKADKHMTDRAKTYNTPTGERSASATVIAFNAVTGHTLSEADGWLFMQLLKDVRQWASPVYHADSAEDSVAYASLKAEALAKNPRKSR